ncbi:MAG: TIGR02453 family protein [Planctomycetes bacterium]|nr:TIGR02453 family protein [Planctomycetota bacterium]
MFDPDLLKFMGELKRNNNRDWFNTNKKRFEASVQAPALAFIRAMAPRLKKVSKSLNADDSKSGGSLFRIYRDVRFAKDKRPYQDYVAMRFLHDKPAGPGCYIAITAADVTLGAGVWQPDKGPLESIRKAIAAGPRAWAKAKAATGWELGGETLARPPKGFDKDNPAIDDIKRKDFVLFKKLKPQTILDKDFDAKVAAEYATAKPFLKFLAEALKLPF